MSESPSWQTTDVLHLVQGNIDVSSWNRCAFNDSRACLLEAFEPCSLTGVLPYLASWGPEYKMHEKMIRDPFVRDFLWAASYGPSRASLKASEVRAAVCGWFVMML